MTYKKAVEETKKLFGGDSFTERDEVVNHKHLYRRYYVGECPKSPGAYQGFMGYSWEEALGLARKKVKP